MDLKEAIEILKIEKGVAELDISNNRANRHQYDFVEAVNTVFNFINDILQISKIGKKNID